MALTNGVLERMKAATHILVSMEIEGSPEPIRDQEAYRRARLPAVYAEHEREWREAYMANPRITINQFVMMVTGLKVEASRVSRSKMERNMVGVLALAQEKPDPELNRKGIARCRAVLRGG